jgi:hypothetical protein
MDVPAQDHVYRAVSGYDWEAADLAAYDIHFINLNNPVDVAPFFNNPPAPEFDELLEELLLVESAGDMEVAGNGRLIHQLGLAMPALPALPAKESAVDDFAGFLLHQLGFLPDDGTLAVVTGPCDGGPRGSH